MAVSCENNLLKRECLVYTAATVATETLGIKIPSQLELGASMEMTSREKDLQAEKRLVKFDPYSKASIIPTQTETLKKRFNINKEEDNMLKQTTRVSKTIASK